MITLEQRDTLTEQFQLLSEQLADGGHYASELSTFGRPDVAVGLEVDLQGTKHNEDHNPHARILALLGGKLLLELESDHVLRKNTDYEVRVSTDERGERDIQVGIPKNALNNNGDELRDLTKTLIDPSVQEIFGVQFSENPQGMGNKAKQAVFASTPLDLGEGELDYVEGRRAHEKWWEESTLAKQVDRAGQVLL